MDHTEGPWNFHRTMGGVVLIECGGSHATVGLQVAVIEHGRISERADARLIAAAPEMLEALETAAEYFVSFPDLLDDKQLPIAEGICAALAKAKNE